MPANDEYHPAPRDIDPIDGQVNYYAPPPFIPAPPPGQVQNKWVTVTVAQDKDATVASLHYQPRYFATYPVLPLDFYATGSARRERGDKFDAETGELLATARALQALGRQLEKKASSRIRSANSIREHHEQIKAQFEATKAAIARLAEGQRLHGQVMNAYASPDGVTLTFTATPTGTAPMTQAMVDELADKGLTATGRKPGEPQPEALPARLTEVMREVQEESWAKANPHVGGVLKASGVFKGTFDKDAVRKYMRDGD
jgi:hypothetical protein